MKHNYKKAMYLWEESIIVVGEDEPRLDAIATVGKVNRRCKDEK